MSGRPRVQGERAIFEQRAMVDPTGGCWEWDGTHTAYGYAQYRAPGRGGPRRAAHRLAYELFVGPLPDDLTIDHLCRNRGCVNPAHLEAVTLAENIRRAGKARRRSFCKYGHAMIPSNEYIRPNDGTRRCLQCIYIRNYQRSDRRSAVPA